MVAILRTMQSIGCVPYMPSWRENFSDPMYVFPALPIACTTGRGPKGGPCAREGGRACPAWQGDGQTGTFSPRIIAPSPARGAGRRQGACPSARGGGCGMPSRLKRRRGMPEAGEGAGFGELLRACGPVRLGLRNDRVQVGPPTGVRAGRPGRAHARTRRAISRDEMSCPH